MNWYIVLIGTLEVASGKRDSFINRFKEIYEANNQPERCALFEERLDNNGWIGYLSSTDATLFAELESEYQHCVPANQPAPDASKINWLAGDRSWSRVFGRG